MRVRVRTTAAGPWGLIGAGQVGIVPDNIGAAMVAARAAEEIADEVADVVRDDAPAQEAVVEAPEAAVADHTRRRRKHAQVPESRVPAGNVG